MARFVGIDPGASGAICLLDTQRRIVAFQPTPNLKCSALSLLNWLKEQHMLDPIHLIAVEDVHSLFGMSAKSNFQFGFNLGQVRTIADMTEIGVELIQPKAWQKACGITFKKGMSSPDRKRHVAATALQLYPKAKLNGPKGGLLDGRADALMIAHFLSIKYGINT